MGTVYRARDLALGRDVALKVLRAETSDERLADRLRREARILAHLEHPGIVPVHDVGTLADGRVFYVMKLVRGTRLDVFAESAGVSEVLRAFLRVVETVGFAHAHDVIHRDLKPANIMVGGFGELLVLDWGIAKITGGAAESGASAVPRVGCGREHRRHRAGQRARHPRLHGSGAGAGRGASGGCTH